jgi:hypothetical protein
VPVFLEAGECIGKLEEAVLEQANGIGDVHRQGAAVIVDGADEAGGGAEELLRECRVLVNTWPHTTIVITSRPLPAFAPELCRDERVDVGLLSDEEAIALIKRLTGNAQFHLFGWPASVRDAVRRPLFAIVFSLYLQNPSELAPRSTGELLAYLVERALGRTTADRAASNALLQRLAVLSTDGAGGFVNEAELATRAQMQYLLDSRLVVERNGAVGFPLAILREWFAAHSLANGAPKPSEVISDRRRLEFWRYPLIMFVSMFGHAQVSGVLADLATRYPGFASSLVEEALPPWGEGEEGGAPNAYEWGLRMRAAMRSWINGIGRIAELIAPVTETRELRPLGITGNATYFAFAWYRGASKLPDILELSSWDLRSRRHDWPVLVSIGASRSSAWAWRLTRDGLRDSLAQLVRGKAFPLDGGPLMAERFWEISQAMAGRGSLRADPIPLLDIEGFLKQIGENETVSLRGSLTLRPSEVAWYRRQVADLLSTGVKEVKSPYPGPDLSGPSKGWIWDNYSDDQLLTRTVQVLQAAVEGYGRLVETWFQALEPELATAMMLPARLN